MPHPPSGIAQHLLLTLSYDLRESDIASLDTPAWRQLHDLFEHWEQITKRLLEHGAEESQ
jgi:hypothetical protein